MINLHSGRPGSGKTLCAIERGIAWFAEGRKVYYLGINGLDEAKTGFVPFPGTLDQWQQLLEPGSVLIVDEIQQYIRRGVTRVTVPDWIEALTRNRHLGIDMLWTTQDPKNIDAFIRRLINEHRHFVNRWGAPKATVYVWHDGVEEVDSNSERDRADKQTWKYPIELYGLYTSAQLHTRKKTTPRKLKILYVSLVVAALCTVLAVYIAHSFSTKAGAGRSPAPPAKVGLHDQKPDSLFASLSGDMKAKKTLSVEEWEATLRPRIEGLLWTAPAFDDRKPVSEPDTYCMAMENGPCKCITEQGTRIKVRDEQCRRIATDGFYNPYKKPIQEQLGRRFDESKPQISVQAAGETAPPKDEKPAKSSGRRLSAPYDAAVFLERSTQY